MQLPRPAHISQDQQRSVQHPESQHPRPQHQSTPTSCRIAIYFTCSIGVPRVERCPRLCSSLPLLPSSFPPFSLPPDCLPNRRVIADCGRQMASQRHRHTAHGSLPDSRGSGRGEGDTRLVSPAREESCVERACVRLHRCSGR